MRKELRQRLASEYRYAATKMAEAKDPARQMFYFSALFGEAQRVLNWEWDRDLVLTHLVLQQVYTQVNAPTQNPLLWATFPMQGAMIYDRVTGLASDLAAYFEQKETEAKREDLLQILQRLAEVSYVAAGNGSYLYEKGLINLDPEKTT